MVLKPMIISTGQGLGRSNPVPVIEKYDEKFMFVKNDLQEGGSKVRFRDKLIRDTSR